MKWQIQEAKARFSELVERTLKEGPQTVTKHGKPVAILIPIDQYRRLKAGDSKVSFKEYLMRAPLEKVELTRSRDRGRAIEF